MPRRSATAAPGDIGWAISLFAVIVFLLDRLTKWIVVEVLDLGHVLRIEVYPPYLTLVMAWNRGINFGIGADGPDWSRWALVGLAVAASIGLTLWVLRRRSVALASFAGIVIGGALGNAWDRIQYGAVADFLNTSCCGYENPFAFNVADIAIFLGAVLIAWRA